MSDLKGTKTEENLKAAFAGESQAHTKYQYFAAKAKEEGFPSIPELQSFINIINTIMNAYMTKS